MGWGVDGVPSEQIWTGHMGTHEQRDMTENSTFPETTYAGGKKWIMKFTHNRRLRIKGHFAGLYFSILELKLHLFLPPVVYINK